MTEELNLLPCPVCGAPVHLEGGDQWHNQHEFFIRCRAEGCGCVSVGDTDRDECIWRWQGLPRAMTWTAEPPKEPGHYWCRYTGSDKATWTPAYIPAVGDLRSYDMEKHERIEWAGPIPMPKEPTE